MPVTVERIEISEVCEIAEGPHWDVETQSLYYVDVYKNTIHKYTPSTKLHTKAVIETTDKISFIIPVAEAANKYLISIGRKIFQIKWDGANDTITNMEEIAEVDTSSSCLENSLCDAKCDVSGRLWCGTIGPFRKESTVEDPVERNRGSVYSMDPDGKINFHLSSITISNGLAWSADNTKMYYIDSGTREIDQYDFDLAKGKISNKKVVFSLKDAGIEGIADGQTIDKDGNLWIAIFGGFRVIKIDPRKHNALLETVDIPAKQVTSVTFGGANLDELYVTTGKITMGGIVLPPPENGAIYRITGLGVQGYPGVRAKLI